MSNSESSSPAFLARGFRPFFLVALVVGSGLLTQWALVLSGQVTLETFVPATFWHGHEMIFGYTMAVVAGFLLTAVRHWTKRETPTGLPLLLLTLIWVCARLAMQGTSASSVHIAVASAFPLVLFLVVAQVIVRAGNRRNYGIVAIVGLLAAANVTALVASVEHPSVARAVLHGAMHLIVLLVAVVGGRIIPLFTRNKLGVDATSVPVVDAVAIGSCALAGAALSLQVVQPDLIPDAVVIGTCGLSGIANGSRMATWQTLAAMREPMLGVLHVAYAWISVGHLYCAFAVASEQQILTPVHALSVGAVTMMTLGMVVRVSMGHTGRPIESRKLATVAFALVFAGAGLRLASAYAMEWTRLLWVASAAFTVLAMTAVLVQVGPWLFARRVDGKQG